MSETQYTETDEQCKRRLLIIANDQIFSVQDGVFVCYLFPLLSYKSEAGSYPPS